MKISQILRSLYRDRLNTLVVIISLSIGMASFNIVMMFIIRELNTDSFQKNNKQIYALICDDLWVPGQKIYYCKFGSAEFMKSNFPQVEDYCRINNSGSQKIIVNKETYFDQPVITSASVNFFSFFSYKLLTNNPASALESKNNIVISEEIAKKYFSHDDPIGRVIEIVNRDKTEKMIVTGVFEKPLENSQLRFDMVRQIGESDSRCYIRLTKDAKQDQVEKLLFDKKESIPIINTGTPGSYFLEPLQKAYFNTGRSSATEISRDKKDLWIAFIIGIMIIGIAIFNYLGVLSNKFLVKIKEFKVRRINGGSSFNIILGFMIENSILIGFSFLVSLYFMFELFPFFNGLTSSHITEKFIIQPEKMILLLAVIVFIWVITLLFASYLIYSEENKKSKNQLTNQVKSVQIPAFNIIQLAGSVALIICSFIIIRQMKFISNKPIGLDKGVIEVKLPGQYSDKASVFKNELMKEKSINCISVVGTSPVLEHFLVALKYQQNGVEKQYSPAGFNGDENYLKVLGINLIEGDGLSDLKSGNTKKCLINQSFAKLFSDQDLIGKSMPGMDDMIITGIVSDFNYSDLKSLVEPAFISYSNKGSHLLVKPSENQIAEARKIIFKVWQELIPDYPINIESVGDRYEWFHRENKNFLKLIVACSLISLFLSMIGLFAISSQRTRARTKEIGIRKINGANIIQILAIITRDLGRWIILAILFASPVAWYVMNKWLENYAYKTEIRWWVIVLAGIITLGVSLLTVSWQSWRAATRNPVETLRYE